MRHIRELLTEVERCVPPPVLQSLQHGADPEDVSVTWKELSLPDDLRAIWTWRDGQDPEFTIVKGESWYLLGAEESRREWGMMLGEVGRSVWCRSWVPLLGNGAGDFVVVDARSGKVIEFRHADNEQKERFETVVEMFAWVIDSWLDTNRQGVESSSSGCQVSARAHVILLVDSGTNGATELARQVALLAGCGVGTSLAVLKRGGS